LRPVQMRHPDDFWVNCDLGIWLELMNPPKYDEALRYCQAALALHPRSGFAWMSLGNVSAEAGRTSEAIEEYREAIRLQPEFFLAHANLGRTLYDQGKYDEALPELRVARERAGPDPEKRLPGIGQMIDKAERMAALAARLPTLLKGGDRPTDLAECL